MIVGTDTYVALAEADGYIDRMYPSASTDYIRWAALSDTDKEIYLTKSCVELEALVYGGRTIEIDQTLSFPRYPYQYANETEAPDNVKFAQIELAVYLTNTAVLQQNSERQALQAQGIKSFNLGDLSESYKDTTEQKSVVFLCPACNRLIKKYTNGGVNTC